MKEKLENYWIPVKGEMLQVIIPVIILLPCFPFPITNVAVLMVGF